MNKPSKKHGRTAWLDCPSCGYKNSLSVTVKDGRELYHCFAGCSQADLLAALRGHAPTMRRERSVPDQDSPSVTAFIEKLWRESLPVKGTPAEVYLHERGIELIPASLRFLPRHLHKPTGQNFPIMLAAAVDWTGRIHAIHRTYLSSDGKGKAPIMPPKMTLGRVGGYSCHLASAGETLAVTEGIETGLSVMQATGIPTWAALSAAGIRNLILPPLPRAAEVVICADSRHIRTAKQNWQCHKHDNQKDVVFHGCSVWSG